MNRLSSSSIGGGISENEGDDERGLSIMVEDASLTRVDLVVDLINEGDASELVVACRDCVFPDTSSVGGLPASAGELSVYTTSKS